MKSRVLYRLRKRAEIRSQIKDRKSVQEGRPDRIALLLVEASTRIEQLENKQDRFLDWFNEMESFGLRSERMYTNLEAMIQTGTVDFELITKWLHAAYQQGRNNDL